ncbi:hypothetical protein DSL72_006992 [Monilinia vaccinii-corymbosi]|uniref:Uncharacterized protein n=1 Tax=Monilinia vaccinii-corymbosi TaxID=61207 RepID=A0A8A3PL75_9HELO|nr:hypothetical protein DSL72_006992 [Monilinia vaccinii-corymbosi]
MEYSSDSPESNFMFGSHFGVWRSLKGLGLPEFLLFFLFFFIPETYICLETSILLSKRNIYIYISLAPIHYYLGQLCREHTTSGIGIPVPARDSMMICSSVPAAESPSNSSTACAIGCSSRTMEIAFQPNPVPPRGPEFDTTEFLKIAAESGADFGESIQSVDIEEDAKPRLRST